MQQKAMMGKSNEMLEQILNWGRAKSPWAMIFGLACCAIEMMIFGAARTDAERHGIFFRASPRQCDLMIVAGTLTRKMAPRIRRLYEQMPEPRYVIALGACLLSGGPFRGGYNTVVLDEILPVDIYVAGCPPRPEAVMHGAMMLQDMIQKGEAGKKPLPDWPPKNWKVRGTVGVEPYGSTNTGGSASSKIAGSGKEGVAVSAGN